MDPTKTLPIILSLVLAAAIGLVGYWVYHSGYRSGESTANNAWQSRWDKQLLEQKNAVAALTTKYRDREHFYQSELAKAAQNADARTKKAVDDAIADASDGAKRMLEQAKRLAATADRGASHAAATPTGQATQSSCGVLADLLGRAESRARAVGVAYEQAREAGLVCEQAYDLQFKQLQQK